MKSGFSGTRQTGCNMEVLYYRGVYEGKIEYTETSNPSVQLGYQIAIAINRKILSL